MTTGEPRSEGVAQKLGTGVTGARLRGADTTDVTSESANNTGDPTGQLAGVEAGESTGVAAGDPTGDRALVGDDVAMGTNDVVGAALIRGKYVSVEGSEDVVGVESVMKVEENTVESVIEDCDMPFTRTEIIGSGDAGADETCSDVGLWVGRGDGKGVGIGVGSWCRVESAKG